MPYKDPVTQSKWQVESNKRRRLAWLAENGPCRYCGSWEDLEVDHIDSSEKVSHRIWSWSQERRESELAKCQALCALCHREKSTEESRALQQNGHGEGAVGIRRCKCDLCLARRAAYTRERRAARAGGQTVKAAVLSTEDVRVQISPCALRRNQCENQCREYISGPLAQRKSRVPLMHSSRVRSSHGPLCAASSKDRAPRFYRDGSPFKSGAACHAPLEETDNSPAPQAGDCRIVPGVEHSWPHRL